ncbi:uncharacterized protein LOC129599172 [Paramacrobiotus metropolitanus]|uniref:uncharacterized protein LOC129599172 n=1 Tax=Paramacrobiotus metropolitanus TaxID=2943436 RepID=UPI0024464637|nr:uncharacterized protein LOC129599172 [Paramacrobiotus metropolitanus]
MFGVFLLSFTGLVSLFTASGDYIQYSIPKDQPTDRAQYVLIEEPWSGGESNLDALRSQSFPELSPGGDPDDSLRPGEKRCPVDGYPNCRDCVAGHKANNFVQTQCCHAHHWAWQNNRTLRDVIPYSFHLSPVTHTTPYADLDKYASCGQIWQEDPCTGEPASSVPAEGYIPWSQRRNKH